MLLSARAWAAQRVILPLWVDDVPKTNVEAWISEGSEEFEIDAAKTLEALSADLDREAHARLLRDGPRLSRAELSRAGLEALLDPSALEVRIRIPALAKKKETLLLSRTATLAREQATAFRPATLSGFLNVNAAQEFAYGSDPVIKGRQPVTAELDSAINYKNWVLESSATAQEGNTTNLRRRDTRFVRDSAYDMMRYQAGDLAYPVRGFQSFVPMAGVAATTQFSLQPYRLVTPAGSRDLILNRRSTVRIWVNGQLAQTLELEPGRHDLRDFPVSGGVNQVRLEVLDDVGRREIIEMPVVFSDDLLSEGLNELSYAAGLPAEEGLRSKSYDSKTPFFSALHRYGFSNAWTGGVNAQFDKHQALGGLSSTIGTRAGTSSFNGVLTHVFDPIAGLKTGQALRVGHEYTDYLGIGASQRTIGLELEGRSPGYAPIGRPTPEGMSVFEATLGYSQQFFDWFALGLSHRRTNQGDQSSSVSLTRAWDRALEGLDTTLQYTHLRDTTGENEAILSFLLTWAFPENHQTVLASHSSQNETSRVEWNYNPATTAGGYNVAAGVERSTLSKGADLRADLTGNRGRLGVTHDSDLYASGTESHRSSLRAGVALAFAGGKFSIGRPISDAFVIVDPIKSMESYPVLLNPRPDGDSEARADWLGPGLVTPLVSYRTYQLHLAAPSAPLGVTLPRENFTLLPDYKSGILIQVGSDAVLVAIGRLTDASGAPLELRTGRVRSVSQPDREEAPFFTNRDGRFMLEGMVSGTYELTLTDDSGPRQAPVYRFSIPIGAEGFHPIEALERVR